MDIDLTFILVTYNQETLVLQALESLRYQMTRYGDKWNIQLIVADDGSSDQTAQRADRWINKNGELFTKVDLLFSDTNRGTCKNVGNAVRLAEGRQILPLAGDDLLVNADVISRLMRLAPNEAIACPCLFFDKGGLIKDTKKYASCFMPKYYSAREVRWRSQFSCPIQNGHLLGRNFYSEDAILFAENYRLIDDRTRNQKALEIMQDFKFGFSTMPILLYRRSETQVTNQNSRSHSASVEDCIKLAKYSSERTINPFTKWRIRMEKIRNTDPDRYRRIWKYCYPGGWHDLIQYEMHKKDIIHMTKDLLFWATQSNIDQYIKKMNARSRSHVSHVS